jgi:hypothetical protein
MNRGVYIGPVTHSFYILLDRLVPAGGLAIAKKLFVERLCFNPPFLFFLLFGLNVFQVSECECECECECE